MDGPRPHEIWVSGERGHLDGDRFPTRRLAWSEHAALSAGGFPVRIRSAPRWRGRLVGLAAARAAAPAGEKPIQYVGGELNATREGLGVGRRPLGLMYPDAYEVGLPNQGVQILYEVLNEQHDVLAERTYAVWPDLEALMREHGVPAVHGRRAPAGGAFDLLGVSFSTELGYTNMLTALDLAGIPLDGARPHRRAPGRLAGGHAAFNPEPIADFIDAAVLGDGEEAVLEITEIVRAWKARGPPGRPRRAAAAAGPHRGGLRPALLRRRLPARRPHPAGRAQPAGRAVPGHKRTTMDLDAWPYPKQAAGAAGRDGARAVRGGDLPRLHPGLPVLPGRHDHPPGAGAVDHRGRRDGRTTGWSSPASTRSACSRCPAPTTPRSATSRKGLADRVRGHATLAVAAVDPGGRLQRRPGRGAVPQRPAHRSDLRARGRLGADPQGDQQDGHRGGPDPHRRHRVHARLAAGEALLHVRPAHRDRRGRAADRPSWPRGDQGRPGRDRLAGHPLHGVDRRVRAQAAHPVPVGGHGSTRRDDRRAGCAKLREAIRRPVARPGDRLPLPRRRAVARSRAAGPRRPPGRRGHPAGVGGRAALRRLERALLVRPLGGRRGSRRCAGEPSTSTGSPPASATRPRCCPGTTSTPAWTRTGSGRTGRTRCAEYEQDDCRWTPCFDCGVCPRWTPRSRSARPAASCCRSTVVTSSRSGGCGST